MKNARCLPSAHRPKWFRPINGPDSPGAAGVGSTPSLILAPAHLWVTRDGPRGFTVQAPQYYLMHTARHRVLGAYRGNTEVVTVTCAAVSACSTGPLYRSTVALVVAGRSCRSMRSTRGLPHRSSETGSAPGLATSAGAPDAPCRGHARKPPAPGREPLRALAW